MYVRMYHRAHVNASVEECWGVFTEHERFKEWTSIDWKIDTPGKEERNGLGCVRYADSYAGSSEPAVELVNIWQPHRIYGYHFTSGIPVLRHQGVVRFWPLDNGGCEWVYDLRIEPTPEVLEEAPEFVTDSQAGFLFFMADIEAECERRAFDIDLPAMPLPVETPLDISAMGGN